MAIDEAFAKTMRLGTGCAVVMAGSGSDKEHIDTLGGHLSEYRIPYQVRICSAHKQPDKLLELIQEYNAIGGSVAYIAIAGGTDALSGTLAFHANGPVISCPPQKDINPSCLTNPKDSSNAYILRPENAARFVAQLFSGINSGVQSILENGRAAKIASLEKADALYLAGEI